MNSKKEEQESTEVDEITELQTKEFITKFKQSIAADRVMVVSRIGHPLDKESHGVMIASSEGGEIEDPNKDAVALLAQGLVGTTRNCIDMDKAPDEAILILAMLEVVDAYAGVVIDDDEGRNFRIILKVNEFIDQLTKEAGI